MPPIQPSVAPGQHVTDSVTWWLLGVVVLLFAMLLGTDQGFATYMQVNTRKCRLALMPFKSDDIVLIEDSVLSTLTVCHVDT
jgi:hypothetical protein